jgi:hypothetical protein
MERQLRMGGGIMSLEPRQQYGLGSIVKSVGKAVKGAVKGAVDTVKDVAKSDLGKTALTAAALYYAPAMFGGTAGFGPGSTYRQFLGGLSPIAIPGTGTSFGGSAYGLGEAIRGGLTSIIPKSTAGKFALGTAAIGGLTGYLAQQGMEEEEIESIKRDPTALRGYLAQYYSNLNPSANPREVDAFVEKNMSEYSTSFATGGRAGFANGNEARTLTYEEAKAMNPSMFMDTTTSAYGDAGEGRPVPRYFEDKMQTLMEAKGGMSPRSRIALFKQYLDEALQTGQISQEKYQRMLMPFFGAGGEKVTQEIEAYNRDERAYGGRMNYGGGGKTITLMDGTKVYIPAGSTTSSGSLKDQIYSSSKGDLLREEILAKMSFSDGGRAKYAFGTPEGNAIQASGIEGIPLNVNPAGATELDMRETGGFVPPVGVKEKADDIPAMLSNNEFVMTADAVREFGDGDVNKGADRMYAMMKTLENGGRV